MAAEFRKGYREKKGRAESGGLMKAKDDGVLGQNGSRRVNKS